MTQSNPSIGNSVSQAYIDAWQAISAMPVVAGVAFLVSLGQSVVEFALLPPVSSERSFFQEIVALLLGGVWSFLFAPFLIAVHRFVLLGEHAARYSIDPGNPRFMLFFQWSFGLLALYSSVSIISSLTGTENLLSILVLFVALVALVIIGLRIILIFPAIAVDAPGISWENAFADTKGHVLRIVLVLVLCSLPLMLVAIFASIYLIGINLDGAPRYGVASALIYAASSTFFGALFVAIASRFYQAYGDRLNQRG